MNSEEAKFILQAYRPGTEDERDPQFIDALELLTRDPELAQWFEEHRQFDRAVRAKLAEVPVPPDLRSRILAGRSLARPKPFYQRPVFLAMAAALALLLAVAGILRFQENESASDLAWEEGMIHFLNSDFRLEFPATDLAEIKDWLAAHAPANQSHLPARLENSPPLGCRTLEWNGRNVALICFNAGPHVVHVFMMNRSDLPSLESPLKPRIGSLEGWSTACWGDERTHYLAVTKGDAAVLKNLLL